MIKYLQNQIREIENDTALRIYGAFLCVANILCGINWLNHHRFKWITNITEANCWPFFENCFEYRFLTYRQAKFLIYGFILLTAINLLLFLGKRFSRFAYFWLIGLTVLNTAIYFQDFRLLLNHHYMLYWVTLVFLFLPQKRNALQVLLVLFYFWAGYLKIHMEWLSGAALYIKPWLVPEHLIAASCVYALILEMVFVFGLLLKNKWLYWAAFVQIILFHVVSFPVVGFFYPVLMFTLLTIFPLTLFIDGSHKTENLLQSLLKGKQFAATYILVGVFSIFQLIPTFMPGNERITGEGRLFALHMFDTVAKCDGDITLRFKDGNSQSLGIPLGDNTRINCDPLYNFNLAKFQCYEHKRNSNFNDLDLYFKTYSYDQDAMVELVDIENFCSQNLNYDLLKPNNWIIKDY